MQIDHLWGPHRTQVSPLSPGSPSPSPRPCTRRLWGPSQLPTPQGPSLKASPEGDRHVTYTCQVTGPSFFFPQLLVGPCHSSRGQESNSLHNPSSDSHTRSLALGNGWFFFLSLFFCFGLQALLLVCPWAVSPTGLCGLGQEPVASPSPSSLGGRSRHQGGLCGPTVRGGKEAGLWRPQLAPYYIGFY